MWELEPEWHILGMREKLVFIYMEGAYMCTWLRIKYISKNGVYAGKCGLKSWTVQVIAKWSFRDIRFQWFDQTWPNNNTPYMWGWAFTVPLMAYWLSAQPLENAPRPISQSKDGLLELVHLELVHSILKQACATCNRHDIVSCASIK